jgi:NADH-quinone oxidoreductase subunit M
MTHDTAALLMNLMIWAPLIGVPFILFLPSKSSKMIAFLTSLVPFAISLAVYAYYQAHSPFGTAGAANPTANLNTFPILFRGASWSGGTGMDISMTLGMDGISVYLVLLTTLLFPLTIFFSFGSVDKHEKSYYALLLILQTGVIGFFLALDMVMFYVFFEMVLIPMYFLIGIWGGKERIYASVKFFLYTLIGSLLMLIAIIYTGFEVTHWTNFSGDYFLTMREAPNIDPDKQMWLFGAFALAFAIKVPLFPLHTWLPDAHTQAPTAGSVILAGVLLKMGTYGLIRFCLPFFPHAAFELSDVMCLLAAIGIIYGGMAAMVQDDVKKLVAYSSVSHLGFIVLGIFSFSREAMSGAVLQMVNHGITTGALFLMVGMIYDRRHTRAIADFGGLARVVPKFTLFFMITVLASVGLPGLNGFVGEFYILMGSFENMPAYSVMAAGGVIVAAVYLLWMFRRVMFGPLEKEENKALTDLNLREVLVMVPLVLIMFIMGFWATPFMTEIDRSAIHVLKPFVPGLNDNPGAPAPAPASHDEHGDAGGASLHGADASKPAGLTVRYQDVVK